MIDTRHFEDHGYLVVPGFLAPEEVHALRRCTRQLPEQLRAHVPPDIGVSWDDHGSIRQVMHAERIVPPLDRLNQSARALDVVRHLLGYDVGLYHSKLLLKDPGGFEVPWHQDYAYWAQWSPHPCQVNCMVYLDDADDENGCLRVVPGSHRHGAIAHGHSPVHGDFHAALEAVDVGAARSLPGPAGTAIFFGPLLFHASRRNGSARHRHSYTTVYTNPLIDVHRGVYSRFFPVEQVKALTGPGPFRFCEEHYQRRNLWQLAVDHVAEPIWPWIEVSDRTFTDGTFEWLSARKDPRSTYVRCEQYPLAWSNRDDVQVRTGRLIDTVPRLDRPAGLVYLDCEARVNAREALTALAPGLVPGTVMLIDRFFNCPDWEFGVYREFQRVVLERDLGFDYLGRCAQQVAIRVTDGVPSGCADPAWAPVSEGIRYA